jgi:hypothetical protein
MLLCPGLSDSPRILLADLAREWSLSTGMMPLPILALIPTLFGANLSFSLSKIHPFGCRS